MAQSEFIDIKWQILRAKWMSQPNLRWWAGLEEAGKTFVANFQPSRYGHSPIPSGLYRRTFNLAREVSYQVLYSQDIVQFYAPHYLEYLLTGTGIFGPSGTPFTSHGPWLMKWYSTGPNRTGQLIVAKQSRGTIWSTKREVAAKEIKKAVTEGIKNYAKGALS